MKAWKAHFRWRACDNPSVHLCLLSNPQGCRHMMFICVYGTLVCDVYILTPLGHSNCIFHMNVKRDLTKITIICEKTRGGRGRNRNNDTPGDITLPAQVSQCSVPFVKNEEVLSTFLYQKVPEQPLSFCLPFIFWTKFSICTVFYSGA